MTWRDQLRPASFRGVGFETVSHSGRGSQRGAHHVYPLRDQGWVEQLGLDDDRLTLEAYVIGDDYFDRRDALIAALKEPGAGELIHPWLGALDVVVDPNAGWSFSESSRRGRMARFSLAFLVAPANGTLPADAPDGRAATDTAAGLLESSALDALTARIDLSGIEAVVTDARAGLDDVFAEIERVSAIVHEITALPGLITSIVLEPLGDLQRQADELLALRDAGGALTALFSAVAGTIGGRIPDITGTSAPGARPAARPPAVASSDPASAARTATAASSALDRARDGSAVQIFQANRTVIDQAADLALLSELARATVRRRYESYGAAIAAMKSIDARVETAIRDEGDAAEPDANLLAALADLRAAAREALLAAAADAAPITTVDTGHSMPTLALAWRVSGSIADEADLIGRNAIAHPLWAPASVEVRQGGSARV